MLPCLLQIRITNPTFGRHVRDASGGEEFMHAAGWTVKVRMHWRRPPALACLPACIPPSLVCICCSLQCIPTLLTCRPCAPSTLQVFEHEKYFVFEPQPGGLEWRVLGEACAELDKLAALLGGKLKVGWVVQRRLSGALGLGGWGLGAGVVTAVVPVPPVLSKPPVC